MTDKYLPILSSFIVLPFFFNLWSTGTLFGSVVVCFESDFRRFLGSPGYKEDTQDLSKTLIPSRGNQTFPALCKHKCTPGYMLTHTSKYTQLFSIHAHTSLCPHRNMSQEKNMSQCQRTCTPLASCRSHWNHTGWAELYCFLSLQGRKLRPQGPWETVWVIHLVRRAGRCWSHCPTHLLHGYELQICTQAPKDFPTTRAQGGCAPTLSRALLGPGQISMREAGRGICRISGYCVDGGAFSLTCPCRQPGWDPKGCFLLLCHWAPQPSHGAQTMSLCDPVSVWRPVLQRAHASIYMSLCVWACACERVCARSRDCRDN